MAKPRLSLRLALEHYDRHLPLLTGEIRPDDFDLEILEVGQARDFRHGSRRHQRFFAGEFEAAECSLCSYLIARDRGLPFVALPIFSRRLFSPSLFYVNTEAGIQSPKDLEGKRVGITSYQVTLAVLAKGDLAHEYGVDWKSITWVTGRSEAIPIRLPADVHVEQASSEEALGEMLRVGEIQALVMPQPPRAVLEGDPRVDALFPSALAEDRSYFLKNQFYPIMHVLCLRDELLQEHPWLAVRLRELFDASFAASERYYDDPNWSRLAWGRFYLDEERRFFDSNPWRNGLEHDANRANLKRMFRYSYEQGIISRLPDVQEWFAT